VLKEKVMKAKTMLTICLIVISASFVFGGGKDDQMPLIHTEEVSYMVDGETLVGLLAYDESYDTKRPAVLVVHEWQGINEYAKKRAQDLAKEGYVAFALDMYGGGKEYSREEAPQISRAVGSDFPLIEKRFNAALDIIKGVEYTDNNNIAAIGYCFGGGIVLNMARMGTDINGVVGFHSSLNTGLTASEGDIQTRVLAFQGDLDPVAPPEKRDAFVEEMKMGGADFAYVVYSNLEAHNFTNPAGSTYYESEAEMAWASMLAFFDEIFE
jgi:dienelactone hydrolase